MIDLIGAPGYATISTPNRNAVAVIQALFAAGVAAPVVAEIGVGIGASTLAMASLLDNRGELHVFDFEARVDELVGDLAARGFSNIRGFGNSGKHWDSYNWTLGRMLLEGRQAVYDYIYIDGAHTFAVDALAFVLADRLLKPGGYLEFDDYGWSFAGSSWMRDIRDQFMTEEQIRTPQVKMVVDLFLNGNANYTAMQPNRLYRKIGGHPAAAVDTVSWRGRAFQVVRHAAVAAAVGEFQSPFEAGTLEFFDAVLPDCDTMIDVGAYVGLMSLYAADRVQQVHAFEASPTNFELLARNVAANDRLRDRIKLFRFGLGDRDEQVPLYRKAVADSGSSIFRTVERGSLVEGTPEAIVALRGADAVLRGIGVTHRTLLKIDIEGAEYLVVPAIAGLLAETKPFLHLSFHPFNLVADGDEYVVALDRLRRALHVAEALSCYRYMYFYENGQWRCVTAAERLLFLRQYLLRPKPIGRIASAQYGFIDAVGFADTALPDLS